MQRYSSFEFITLEIGKNKDLVEPSFPSNFPIFKLSSISPLQCSAFDLANSTSKLRVSLISLFCFYVVSKFFTTSCNTPIK